MDIGIQHQEGTLTGLSIGKVNQRQMYVSVINKAF